MKHLSILCVLLIFACTAKQPGYRPESRKVQISSADQKKHATLVSQIDSLAYVAGEPLDCGTVTWRIIAARQAAIPLLIDELDNQKRTANADYCVGDIALMALEKIMRLPYATVTGIQCCLMDCDLMNNLKTDRQKVKYQILRYYTINRVHLVWEKTDTAYFQACEKENHLDGRYDSRYCFSPNVIPFPPKLPIN